MAAKRDSRGTVTERFWAKTERRGDDECWPWRGATDGTGYGHLYIDGKLRQAHRVSWELANGRPLPPGMNACHRCNVRDCVNPRHIYPDTQAGNIQYAVASGRHFARSRGITRCKNGHEFTEENTYIYMRRGRPTRNCRICTNERTKRWLSRGNQK